MGYKLVRWSDPHRRRILNISYKDPRFCKYYDLDQNDFTYLVSKMKINMPLSEQENDRLGMHIFTMILNVLESPKWKKKSEEEREDLLEFASLELTQALPKFDPTLGKKIYSYAFTCCVNAFNLKYRKEKREKNKDKRIQKHLDECFRDYLGEITDGKVNTQEYD